MKNKVSRKEKFNYLKAVMAGTTVKKLVVFCEYKQVNNTSPSTYIDSKGALINETEMHQQLTEASKEAEIVWHEIKTYSQNR